MKILFWISIPWYGLCCYAINVKCFLLSRLKLEPGSDSDEERGGDQDQDGQKLKQEKSGGNGITTAKKLEKDFLC